MILITKWVERIIQRKQEKKREETKLKNWFKLYKVLHGGAEPTCLNCANNRDCFKKYGKKKEKWPLINGIGSCQSFKEDTPSLGRSGFSGRGVSGVSGFSGMGGFSGYVKYNGKQPPWQRGANSCNHLCQSCSYFKNNACSKP